MPVFFFHVRTPDGLIEDPEGIELQGIDQVRKEAALSAREIMQDALAHGRLVTDQSFEVMNEAGVIVLTYGFAEACEPPSGSGEARRRPAILLH